MAARTVFLAILLAAASAVVTAQSEADLRKAITDPKVKSFILYNDITLTRDLPPIPDNKLFSLIGKKGGKDGAKVKIDGANYLMFKNGGDAPVILHLENLIITGAKAESAAVTLTVLGTKLTATNVDFNSNPQGLALTSVDAILKKCTFSSHTSGAISLEADEGEPDKVVVDSCTFTNNKAYSGAGVYCGKYTTLEVTKSKFIRNTASYRGGAIQVRESAFATIKSSEFTGNTAQEQGGAITVFNAGITISSSKFTNNKAIAGPGGALRVGSASLFGAVATVTTSEFSGNSGSSGGAFVMDTADDNTEISFCKTTFNRNSPNTGFVIGTTNTILTKGGASIRGVVKDTSAVLVYKANPKCK